MGISSVYYIDNKYGVEDVATFVRDHLADKNEISLYTYDNHKNMQDRHYQIIFTYKGEDRILSCGNYPSDAQNAGLRENYSRIGSVNMWGYSEEIIKKIVSNFGGYYQLNDCDGDPVPYFEGTKSEITEDGRLYVRLQLEFGKDAEIIFKHRDKLKVLFS